MLNSEPVHSAQAWQQSLGELSFDAVCMTHSIATKQTGSVRVSFAAEHGTGRPPEV